MITHHDLTTELGGLMCETRMFEGLYYLISLAEKMPGEIHRFETIHLGKPVTVMLAISEEARAKLDRRLARELEQPR